MTTERFFELLNKINNRTATPAEFEELKAYMNPRRFEDDPQFTILHRDPPTTLTTGQQTRLLLDVTLGRPPSITGEEAERFYAKLVQEVEQLVAQGYAIDVPNELPDVEDLDRSRA